MLIFITAFISNSCFSQTTADSTVIGDSLIRQKAPLVSEKSKEKNVVIFHTPEQAALIRAIDNPVGLYNGNPEVSYNLYTLKDGVIELPITLQYNTSGIKVAEEASWVGLGWDLNLGGMIVQEAVGEFDIPEHLTTDLSYNTEPTNHEGYTLLNYRQGDKGQHSSFVQYATEGGVQPDVFYYRFPGHSGKFFIDYRDNSIHQLNIDKSVHIERIHDTAWLITTEDGTRYYFEDEGYSWFHGASDGRSSRKWALSATEYINGQSVGYYYSRNAITSISKSETQEVLHTPIPGLGVGTRYANIYYSETRCEGNELVLDSIRTDHYCIRFEKDLRDDLQNGTLLRRMVIESNDKSYAFRKSFTFNHCYSESENEGNYWTSQVINSDQAKKRLQLLSVDEEGIDGSKLRLLEFSYNDFNKLPPKTSYAVDYWGFYNGGLDNSGMIPSLATLYGEAFDSSCMMVGDASVSRAPSVDFCKYGMLKCIKFATGGVMEYVYEPNTFNTSWKIINKEEYSHIPECPRPIKKLANLKCSNSVNDTNSFYTHVSENEEYWMEYYICKGLNTWKDLIGTKATIFDKPPHIIEQHLFDGNETGDYIKGSIRVTTKKGELYFSIALPHTLPDQNANPTSGHAYISATIYKRDEHSDIPSALLPSYSVGCGLRVKAVNYYDNENDSLPLYTTAYEYPEDSIPNGRLHIPIAFHRFYPNVCYSVERKAGSVLEDIFGIGSKELTLSSQNLISAPYSTIGSLVGYSKVIVRHLKNGEDEGYEEYHFSNSQETGNSSCGIQIPNVEKGDLTATTCYDKHGNILKTTRNTYSLADEHFYYGVTATNLLNRVPEFYTLPGGSQYIVEHPAHHPYTIIDFDGRYQFMQYGIRSFQKLLTATTVTTDSVTMREEFRYDSKGQVSEKSWTDSQGHQNMERYTYPHNFSYGIYGTMKAQHITGLPVECKQYSDGKLTDGTLHEYVRTGSLNGDPVIMASAVRSKTLASPSATDEPMTASNSAELYPRREVEFLKYTIDGNPVQVKINGEEVVYLWGYGGLYPVAEIRGSDYSRVQTALGISPLTFSVQNGLDEARLESIRNRLSSASITTYSYIPLLGMISKTLPNGEKVTYEYDSFGRLTCVKDKEGNVKETIQYHYRKE